MMEADLVGQASWDTAKDPLRRVIDGDPGILARYLDLSETYRLQGKKREAMGAQRRFGRADPAIGLLRRRRGGGATLRCERMAAPRPSLHGVRPRGAVA